MGAFHILDIGGIDHLLFIASVVLVYSFAVWKKVLLLLTSFTVGHALALILVATELIKVPTEIIEFLIPLSILVMAVLHLWQGRTQGRLVYWLCLIFGLIHGTAYAQGFSAMFNKTADRFQAAIGFNLGVELGQLAFGLLLMGLTALLTSTFGRSQEKVRIFIFGAIIAIACQLLWQNRLW